MSQMGCIHQRVAAIKPDQLVVRVQVDSPHTFSAKEYACIASHVLAMQTAILRSSEYKNPYALILEDDVKFNFFPDFKRVIQSAPKNFTFIQLVTSNVVKIAELCSDYEFNHVLFSKRDNNCWSTQGYLVNLESVRHYIFNILRHNDRKPGTYHMFVKPFSFLKNLCESDINDAILRLNGQRLAAVQAEHINQNSSRPVGTGTPGNTSQKSVYYKLGAMQIRRPVSPEAVCWIKSDLYVEDFLFNSNQSYISTVPILNGDVTGLISTVHQVHVELYHKPAFLKIEGIAKGVLNGTYSRPSYVLNCNYSTSA